MRTSTSFSPSSKSYLRLDLEATASTPTKPASSHQRMARHLFRPFGPPISDSCLVPTTSHRNLIHLQNLQPQRSAASWPESPSQVRQVCLRVLFPTRCSCSCSRLSMVTLASMFVLSEYLTAKDGQHSSGKLRAKCVTDSKSIQREEHCKSL